MSRFGHFQSHSASVRAEMKALDLGARRLSFGAMLVSVVAGANAASVIATLLSF